MEDGPAVADALRTGGADGLSDVYARWSPLVYSLALRALGDVAAAEEVTKQVFTEVWSSRGTPTSAQGSFSAWLIDRACARIAALERSRRGAPASAEPVAAEESPDGASGPVALAERMMLADGLSHLDPGPQRVLRMVLDDVSPAEVAERTGLSVEDVKTQVASSLVELRQRWEVRTDAR